MDEDSRPNGEELEPAVEPAPRPVKEQKPPFTLKPSRETCIALAALTGVVLLSGVGLWFWQSKDLDELDKAAKIENGKLESNERILTRKERVALAYETARGKLRYLETSVSANEYVPTLLKQMEQLGKSVDLRVDAIRPTLEPKPVVKKEDKKEETPAPATNDAKATAEKKPKAESWPYDKMHIDMQVRGTYWNVARMLYRLNEFPKILAVEGITMQPREAKLGSSPTLSVTLKLTGFIFPTDGQSDDMSPEPGTTAVTLPPAAGGTSASAPAVGAPVAASAPAQGTTRGMNPPVLIPGTKNTTRLRSEQEKVMSGK